MNILFFLIPKSQVAYVEEDFTLRQVVEKLQNRGYAAIPVLSRDGKFLSVVAEGDLFWYIKDQFGMNFKRAENTNIMEVPVRRKFEAIRFDAKMEDLLNLAMAQNFVPVLDDHGIFMGIVTRKAIISWFLKDSKKID